jgi:predicted membrane protein
MVATMVAGLTIRFVPLGLAVPIVKYGGSMLWALMIYWIVSAFLPSLRLLAVALISPAIATVVEFFKLHHAPALDAFRLTIPGILLLGRVFSAWDVLAYWLAILIAVFVDRRIRPGVRATMRNPQAHAAPR